MKSFLKRQLSRASKKKVNFKTKPQIFNIPGNDVTSAEEIWYTSRDYGRMNQENRQTISDFHASSEDDNEKENEMRGLESVDKIGRFRMKLTRREALSAVLATQEVQQIQGNKSLENIARIYHDITLESVNQAREVGRVDEAFVNTHVRLYPVKQKLDQEYANATDKESCSFHKKPRCLLQESSTSDRTESTKSFDDDSVFGDLSTRMPGEDNVHVFIPSALSFTAQT